MSEAGGPAAGAKADTSFAIGVSAVLVGLAALVDDAMLPFQSAVFTVGTVAAYYLAATSGPMPGLMVGVALLTAMTLKAVATGGEALDALLWQAPIMAVFYAGLALLPGVLPTLLVLEKDAFDAESEDLERKKAELDETIEAERGAVRDGHVEDHREALVKITSRTTQLSAFLREVLQAASTKEILQLYFTNVTKSFGAQEVALLTMLEGGDGVVINKAAHPEYGALEGKRVAFEDAELLRRAAEKAVPMLLPARVVYFEPDLGAQVLLPVRVQGRCVAVVTLGHHRGEGPVSAEDAHFLGGLADLAGRGIEQLQVVLNT